MPGSMALKAAPISLTTRPIQGPQVRPATMGPRSRMFIRISDSGRSTEDGMPMTDRKTGSPQKGRMRISLALVTGPAFHGPGKDTAPGDEISCQHCEAVHLQEDEGVTYEGDGHEA
jgi:hypothetical protein